MTSGKGINEIELVLNWGVIIIIEQQEESVMWERVDLHNGRELDTYQVATIETLHDQMHAFGCLHRFVHAGDARMWDLFHDLDLAVHSLPVCGIFQFRLIVGFDYQYKAVR